MARPFRPPQALSDRQLMSDVPTEMLAAACWCDRHFVLVHRDDVKNGVTKSCGRPDCRRVR